MELTIIPHKLQGSVSVPASKSMGHRYLIAAALADGESRIDALTPSADLYATIAGLRALGAVFEQTGDTVLVRSGCRPLSGEVTIFCGESGSTLRFLIPVALALSDGQAPIHFTGSGKLLSRPLEPYFSIFDTHDICWEHTPECLTIQGTLTPGSYTLAGNISSQFITGLLFALPILSGDSTLTIMGPLESAGYLDLSRQALAAFGVEVPDPRRLILSIRGKQCFSPRSLTVEGDDSQAAFFFAANELGSTVDVIGLNTHSQQGDRAMRQLLEFCRIAGEELSINLKNTPDLAPALAVTAAFRSGKQTRLTGCERLRMKESDRVSSICGMLTALGGMVREQGSDLLITGVDQLDGGTVDCCNDHRIAMAAAVAATRCAHPVTLQGAECVAKSYPDFWKDYQALGGICKITKEGSV